MSLETILMTVFSSTVFTLSFSNALGAATPWLSILVGGFFGFLFSILHAVATVNFRADHIISGTVLNLLAPGLCVFLTRIIYNGKGQTPIIEQGLGTYTFPGLSKIPVLGKILFTRTSLVSHKRWAASAFRW